MKKGGKNAQHAVDVVINVQVYKIPLMYGNMRAAFFGPNRVKASFSMDHPTTATAMTTTVTHRGEKLMKRGPNWLDLKFLRM